VHVDLRNTHSAPLGWNAVTRYPIDGQSARRPSVSWRPDPDDEQNVPATCAERKTGQVRLAYSSPVVQSPLLGSWPRVAGDDPGIPLRVPDFLKST